MKRFTDREYNQMIKFFKLHLSQNTDNKSLIKILNYSISLEYRSLSLENLGLIHDVEEIFHRNIDKFSEEAQENFFHEYGHLYEALLRYFRFESIHIIDHDTEHVFFRKFYSSYNIGYICKRKSKKNEEYSSYSLFSKRFATVDDLKMIALGGFKQDFIRQSKSAKRILTAFGIEEDSKIIDKSDASYIVDGPQIGKTKYLFFNRR